MGLRRLIDVECRTALRWLVCIGLVALSLGLAAAPAWAAMASVTASELPGHARIVLTFDNPPRTSLRNANGILVVSFSEPVTLDRERLAAELPNYVSIVRIDPDGRGLRLALARPVRPSMTEAGERLYLDLLPPTYRGIPPGLPKEVIDDLARRARVAEARIREHEQRAVKEEPKPLAIRVGSLPTLTRLVLTPPRNVPISLKRDNDRVELVFEAPLRVETARLKAALPQAVVAVAADESDVLRLMLTLAPGRDMVGFREDESYVLDFPHPVVEAVSPEAPQPAPAPGPATRRETKVNANTNANAVAERTAPVAAGAAVEQRPASPPAAAAPTSEPAQPPAPPASSSVPEPRKAAVAMPTGPVRPVVTVVGEGLRIAFPFTSRTGAAFVERDGVVTLVFDSIQAVEAGNLVASANGRIEAADAMRRGIATVIRIVPANSLFVRLAAEGQGWVLTLGDDVAAAGEPMTIERGVAGEGRMQAIVAVSGITGVHWIDDAASGERMAVATALAPVRGLPKPQRFLEFEAPATGHGVAILARADDLVVRPGIDGLVISRESGLALSPAGPIEERNAQTGRPTIITRDAWVRDRAGIVRDRVRELTGIAADASRGDKMQRRLALAHLLLANGLAAEAEGVLGVIAADEPKAALERQVAMLRAAAAVLRRHHGDAHRFLALPNLVDDREAALWRAVVDARTDRLPQALAAFRRSADILDNYPEDLQALVRPLVARAAIAADDRALAAAELDTLARLPSDDVPRTEVALLRARLDELAGLEESALEGYRAVGETADRPFAAEAVLRGTALALERRAITPEEALARFETLSIVWRGDDVEARTLGHLGRLYAQAGQWRQAFLAARRANQIFPDHPVTRALHDDTARLFETLFLSGNGESLSRVDALALYYDFKEFTPVGRLGDEMLRRLADRLVELDLLDQAADLLQYQVDNRISGAARATVATRLAMLRLMNARPALALAVLQETRLPELPGDIRRARFLLEARALSDLSRTDLALEILAGEVGPEVDRLRADILWQGRRWRDAGETYERIPGARWQGREPLGDQDRIDVMRAAIAYALADEVISLDRLRGKYATKMADSVDGRTFGFLTGRNAAASVNFREIARSVANADTLAEFLAEYRKRYPEASIAARARPAPAAVPGRG